MRISLGPTITHFPCPQRPDGAVRALAVLRKPSCSPELAYRFAPGLLAAAPAQAVDFLVSVRPPLEPRCVLCVLTVLTVLCAPCVQPLLPMHCGVNQPCLLCMRSVRCHRQLLLAFVSPPPSQP